MLEMLECRPVILSTYGFKVTNRMYYVKQFLVAIFMSLVLVSAGSAQDCVLPKFDHTNVPSAGEELRKLKIGMAKYILCVEALPVDSLNFPGEKALAASYIARLKAELKLLENRLSVPSAKQFGAANPVPEGWNNWGDYAIFRNLSSALSHEFTGDKDANEYLSFLRENGSSKGLDARTEAARLAKELRFPLPRPWFSIGNLTITRGSSDATGLRLRMALDTAADAYGASLADLSMAREQLSLALKARSAALDPLQAEQQIRQRDLSALLRAHAEDPKSVRAGKAYQDLTAIVERSEKRILELNRATTHLFRERGDSSIGETRIRALQDEREAEELKAELARQDRDLLFAPNLPPGVADKVKVLNREIATARQNIDRRGRIFSTRIEDAQDRIERQSTLLAKAAQARQSARDALAQWMDNLRLLRVTGITTEHATFIEADADEQEKFQAHLDALRREIRARKADLHDLNVKRGEARVAMLQAGDAANAANIKLSNTGFASYMAQATIEIGFAAKDLAKAAEAGPAVFFAEATRQIVLNTAFPPSYYDAASHTLSEYALNQPAPRAAELVDIHEHVTVHPAAKNVGKRFAAMPFNVVLKELEEAALKTRVDAARGSYMWAAVDAAPAKQANLLKYVWAQEGKLAEVTQELAEMTGRAGKKAFAAHAAVKFGSDLAKGIAKEAVKKGLAELIEGGALEDYMLAQLELAQAVARFKHAGNLYWANHDALVILEAMLDGLERRQAKIGSLVDTRNDSFYVEEGYRIQVDIAGGSQADVSGLKGTLTLGGVPLERDELTTALVWTIPKAALDLFDLDQPERLPLVLTVE